MLTNANGQYDISQDKDYIKINYNESSKKLYNHIKDKAISIFRQFKHTRHALVGNTKISKDGKTANMIDTGGDLNLAVEGIKKLIDITEVRNETFNVITI